MQTDRKNRQICPSDGDGENEEGLPKEEEEDIWRGEARSGTSGRMRYPEGGACLLLVTFANRLFPVPHLFFLFSQVACLALWG